jgi:hypothetical protein
VKLSERLTELNAKGEYPGTEEIELAKRLEETFDLLAVIAMEFKTDPQSVACFDLRIVQRAIELTRTGAEPYEPSGPAWP